jgi:predicted ATPase
MIELHRYGQNVFAAPPWPAIYVTDKERKQSFAEAIRTYELMVRVYEDLEYKVLELTLVPGGGARRVRTPKPLLSRMQVRQVEQL